MKRGVIHSVTATMNLIGTIVGVGMFSTPLAFSKSGFVGAVVLVGIVAALQILIHLFYAEAVIASKEHVRLPGLAEKYLGKGTRNIVGVIALLQSFGSMLAYTILGGIFLHILLSPYIPWIPEIFQVTFGLLVGIIIAGNIAWVSRIELWATLALIAVLVGITIMTSLHINPAHYFAGGNQQSIFLTYGVLLFALSGLQAIPEMEEVLRDKHRYYRTAIISGILTSTVLVAAFGFAVWGVSGTATTEDAVSGLRAVLGDKIIFTGSILGFLAIITSYITVANNTKQTLHLDFKWKKSLAWLATITVPLFLITIASNSLLKIVSFSGAVLGGSTAIIVCLLYIAITKKNLLGSKKLGIPPMIAYITITTLVAGIIGKLM